MKTWTICEVYHQYKLKKLIKMPFDIVKYFKYINDYHIIDIEDDDKPSININTKKFTDLTDIVILEDDHPFYRFFTGFTHNMYKDYEIYHGYYHVPTGMAKFFVQNPIKIGNALSIAWKKYINTIYYPSIYKSYYGELYKSNEYQIDEKVFYKQLICHLMNEL